MRCEGSRNRYCNPEKNRQPVVKVWALITGDPRWQREEQDEKIDVSKIKPKYRKAEWQKNYIYKDMFTKINTFSPTL